MASSPSLLRRLATILYDGLLLAGILFFATALVVVPLGGHPETSFGLWAFRAYLTVVTYLFFGWFWVHGGQTLGMRAWRLRVVRRQSGNLLDWHHAACRFAAAALSWVCLGLGFLWMLIDREHLTWHDRLSDSKLVLLPKSAPNHNTPP